MKTLIAIFAFFGMYTMWTFIALIICGICAKYPDLWNVEMMESTLYALPLVSIGTMSCVGFIRKRLESNDESR